MALAEEKKQSSDNIVALLTTVTEGVERISMHGVRRSLLEMQASSLGLPLVQVRIPQNSRNEDYESRMKEALEQCISKWSIDAVVFGDLFLEDVRQYRERNMENIGIGAVFPLWKKDTRRIAEDFLSAGFRAAVCCIDTDRLDDEFCGAEFDSSFLESLPGAVDPCGENGEFHTFVYDGPVFSKAIRLSRGERVRRDHFLFADLLPA